MNVCLRLGEFSSGTFQVLVFCLVHPCPSEPSADPSAGSLVPSVSPTPVCVSAQSGQLSSSQVRPLYPQQPPHLGAAPERDPGASRAVSQARNPPSSSSCWSFSPAVPEFLQILPRSAMSRFRPSRESRERVAHHLSPRATSARLGHGLERQCPAIRSLAGFLPSLSRVSLSPRCPGPGPGGSAQRGSW